LDGSPARRITVARGTINVSPTFSPDGRRLAFTSSRSGHPEVYVMDADGTNAELLTPYVFGEQSYQSNPDWSPDGRMVAYQSQIAGRFQVKTINLRDRTTRQLTSEGQNEDPSWAPDGRHLVFASSRTGVRELWVIDVENGRARQLTRGPGARLPAWSRRLRSPQSP
jgi:TolB protein